MQTHPHRGVPGVQEAGHRPRLRFLGSNTAKDMEGWGAKQRRPGKRGFPRPSLGTSGLQGDAMSGAVPGHNGGKNPVQVRPSGTGKAQGDGRQLCSPPQAVGLCPQGGRGDMVTSTAARSMRPTQWARLPAPRLGRMQGTGSTGTSNLVGAPRHSEADAHTWAENRSARCTSRLANLTAGTEGGPRR